MNHWRQVLGVLGILSFAVIATTGIDLINSRTGLGMLGLGGGLFLVTLMALAAPPEGHRFGVIMLVLASGSYFLGRAWLGGPESLAFADITLVLIGLGVYLGLVLSNERSRRIWMGTVIVLAIGNAGIALYQQWSPEIYYFWQERSGGKQMVAGLFGHYNAFASYLNGSVFFILSYAILGKKPLLRIVFGLGVVAIVAALIFSGSRGGWLSFVIGAVVWLVFLVFHLKAQGSRLFGPAILGGVLLAVVGGVTSIDVVRNLTEDRRVQQSPDREDREVNLAEADGGRFAFQQMAFEIFQDEPLLGAGPQAFSYRSLEKWDPDSLGLWTNLPVYAHNEFMQVLSDYGLVGFLIVVALVFVHLLLGLSRVLGDRSSSRELVIWQIGAAAGLTAILSQCFFSFLFHYPACIALAAVQLGVLASVAGRSRRRIEAVSGRMVAVGGLAVAAALVLTGWPLWQSYLLRREGVRKMAAATTQEDALKAFDTWTQAGNLARDPDLFERVARQAMAIANRVEKKGEVEMARRFNLRAKEALVRALELNPYFGEGIAGLPRVNDKLGLYEEAEQGHQEAMEKLWTREYSLRPHYQAARSAFFKAFRAQSDDETLYFLNQSRERLQRRLEVLRRKSEPRDTRDFARALDAWIAFYEGRLLFQKGDDIWKNARPRNPGLAHALLLEARKRYRQSRKEVAEKDPRWQKDMEQLDRHLGFLKAGRTEPTPLTEEELRKFLRAEVGLASDEGKR